MTKKKLFLTYKYFLFYNNKSTATVVKLSKEH